MKIYAKLIGFARPIAGFATIYLIVTILGTIFGLANIGLVIPLLNVIFSVKDSSEKIITELPSFSLTIDYAKDTFNYYFQKTMAEQGKQQALLFVSIITVIAMFFSSVFKYLGVYILAELRARTIYKIRIKIFEVLTKLHLGYFSEQRKGEILTRANQDVQHVEYTLTHSFFSFMKEPISIIAFFVMLFSISTKLTFFTLILLPISGVVISLISNALKKYARQGQNSIAIISSILDETLSGIRVIKSFNAGEYVREKFNKESGQYTSFSKKMTWVSELASPTSEFLGVMTITFILYYGGILVLEPNSQLTGGAFVGYIIVFSQMLNPVKSLAFEYSNVQKGLVSGKRILELLDTKPDIEDKPNAVVLKPFHSEIEFRNVSFGYDESRKVLQKISFTMQKGKMVALVGASGGGKSTIADLLTRFYDVQEGEVLFDGINIKDCTNDSLIDQIGVVSQECILFNDTIFNNIAFGKTATQDEVIQAAKIANAHDFIMEMPNGYQTNIGERGTKLSGGQRQRVSIARAILRNPTILILDEATSALDTTSEKLVQEALTSLMKNRTSLVIAHRLSTIQSADEILVLQNGEITERGTHEMLLNKENGAYRKLSQIQSIEVPEG